MEAKTIILKKVGVPNSYDKQLQYIYVFGKYTKRYGGNEDILLCCVAHASQGCLSACETVCTNRNKHGSDLCYDLETMQYIERDDVNNFFGKEVLMVFVPRLFLTLCNYYEDKSSAILPILKKTKYGNYSLTFSHPNIIPMLPIDIPQDISTTWKCDCVDRVKDMWLPSQVDEKNRSELSTQLKERSYKVDDIVVHPVRIKQDFSIDISFYNYERWFAEQEYNNYCICAQSSPTKVPGICISL